MYVCNGILFNHESPRRGETFVTRKIPAGWRASLIGMALEGRNTNLLDFLKPAPMSMSCSAHCCP
jgi:hypothetical protein